MVIIKQYAVLYKSPKAILLFHIFYCIDNDFPKEIYFTLMNL